MLKLTRKTEYALMALSHLSDSASTSTTKVREIADAHGIPFPVLAKVMQQLARKGFVEPIQGAQGGYRLRSKLSDVNLWQFLQQMEGPIGIVDCVSESDCTQMGSCNIRTPMRVIDTSLRSVFHHLTLEHVIQSSSPVANRD